MDFILIDDEGSYMGEARLSMDTHYELMGTDPSLPSHHLNLLKDYHFSPTLEVEGEALQKWLDELRKALGTLARHGVRADDLTDVVRLFEQACVSGGRIHIETD